MKLVLEANRETNQFSMDDGSGDDTFDAIKVLGMLEFAKLQVVYDCSAMIQKMESNKLEVEDEA